MADPLSSQAWVAAWLQKAEHEDLLTRCAEADQRFADWADRLAALSAFGTIVRYPSADADPTVEDVSDALLAVRHFHEFVSSILLNQPLPQGPTT